LVLLVHREPRVYKELLEIQVLKDLLEALVHKEQLEHKELQEQPVVKVPQVLQDPRVLLDPKAQLDLRVLRVVLDCKGLKEYKVF
jgi:hypothetical protein